MATVALELTDENAPILTAGGQSQKPVARFGTNRFRPLPLHLGHG